MPLEPREEPEQRTPTPRRALEPREEPEQKTPTPTPCPQNPVRNPSREPRDHAVAMQPEGTPRGDPERNPTTTLGFLSGFIARGSTAVPLEPREEPEQRTPREPRGPLLGFLSGFPLGFLTGLAPPRVPLGVGLLGVVCTLNYVIFQKQKKMGLFVLLYYLTRLIT